MNLLAGMLILICLVGSEMTGFKVAEDLWFRLLAVALAALVVPGLAFFRTAAAAAKNALEAIAVDEKGPCVVA